MTSCKNIHIIFFLCLLMGIYSSATKAQSVVDFQINGIVSNSANQPITGASVVLTDIKTNKVVRNGLTNVSGDFNLHVPSGSYLLTISYLTAVIHRSEEINVERDVDLGRIKLETRAQNLKEVVIKSVSNKPLIQVEGRKVIYAIENSTTSQGTNVMEALQKTPGVIVNQDNSVTINGSSAALVLINGRQTYLQTEELAQLLKSMASSDLKSIEIIKNPTAEYDAAGTGGILNLVLKKNTIEGFNLSLNNGVAYGKTVKQNTNVSLNFREGKLNAFGNYNHNFGYYAMEYDNDRTTNGKIYLNSNSDIDKRYSIGSTLGADYAIDTMNTIGVVFNANFRPGPGLIIPITQIYNQTDNQLLQTLRSESIYSKQSANRYNFNLNYRYKGKDNSTFDIDADYGLFKSGTDNLSTNMFFSPEGEFQSSNNFLVRNSRDIKLYAIKADYGFSLGKGRLATGVKLSSVTANNVFDQFDANGTENSLDINLSNTFDYTERISAGYLKYERSISNKINMDFGVRMENTHAEGNLQPRAGSTQLPNAVTRNYLDFFPTAGITLTTERSGIFNLSFARRIDRPAYNNLNPFSYPIDALSSWTGNPFLQPQYANTLSLQYSIKAFTIAAAYTHTSDISSAITEVIDSERVMSIPRNIGFQNNFNLTLTRQLKIADWWNMSITGIGYHLQNNVGTPEFGYYKPSRFSGNLNLQQRFQLPGQITAEAVSVFKSKRITGLNTYVNGNSQIDIGFQKNVMGDKGTIRLAATDIFLANRINSSTQLNGLLLNSTYVGESRQVRLNFSYRFGNNKVKSKVERESGLQTERQRF